MAANGSIVTIASAIGASVVLSVAAAIYSSGYEDAKVEAIEAKVVKLEDTPEQLSGIKAVLKEINRRLNRIDTRLDRALGENGK